MWGCGEEEEEEALRVSHPAVYSDINYSLTLSGVVGTAYSLTLRKTETDISVSSEVNLSGGLLAIRSFTITEEQIKSDRLAYVRISATSENKTLNSTGSERNVAKLIVTQQFPTLGHFYKTKDYSSTGQKYTIQMLSFSTFGAITLSAVSSPPLAIGTWYIGIVQDSQTGEGMADKTVKLETQIVTNYSYDFRILLLLCLGLTGAVFPVISRCVFDYNNFRHTDKIRFRVWLGVVRNWVWRGDKGYPYLMTLLMVILSVSALQVVNAKWTDMVQYGDRDICYYNERCYRPHGSYDISVNDCASNLPFMVHGVILVLYFSFCEAYCKSVGHMYFDYSIPYAFGVTLICQGFGSLLYHICPSQIIFQFDTMFMFMISILQIVGIFAGYSVRENDVIYKYNTEKAPKALRPNKVICFFVGPIYVFNFLGNLSATQGLPVAWNVIFYVGYSIWLLLILAWAAYKLDLLNASWLPEQIDPNIASPEDNLILESIFTPTTLTKIQLKTRRLFKKIVFGIYTFLAIIGAPIAFLQYIPFSIYLLCVLTIAVLGLTYLSFIPLMHRLVVWVRENHNGAISCGRFKFWGTNQVVIVVVMIGYVAIGCVFSTVSLIFFMFYEATDKSLDPWLSRELNDECFADDFYSAHDIWHVLASFSLMIMILVNVQIGKPCRDCYLSYLTKDQQKAVRRITWKSNIRVSNLGSSTLDRIFKNRNTTI